MHNDVVIRGSRPHVGIDLVSSVPWEGATELRHSPLLCHVLDGQDGQDGRDGQ